MITCNAQLPTQMGECLFGKEKEIRRKKPSTMQASIQLWLHNTILAIFWGTYSKWPSFLPTQHPHNYSFLARRKRKDAMVNAAHASGLSRLLLPHCGDCWDGNHRKLRLLPAGENTKYLLSMQFLFSILSY